MGPAHQIFQGGVFLLQSHVGWSVHPETSCTGQRHCVLQHGVGSRPGPVVTGGRPRIPRALGSSPFPSPSARNLRWQESVGTMRQDSVAGKNLSSKSRPPSGGELASCPKRHRTCKADKRMQTMHAAMLFVQLLSLLCAARMSDRPLCHTSGCPLEDCWLTIDLGLICHNLRAKGG